MRNIRLVSNDAELIARVKDALAPLDVRLETSEDFPIEGCYREPEEIGWAIGCLWLLLPWLAEKVEQVSISKEKPPDASEVKRRSQVDILILDMIRDENYRVLRNIKRISLWGEVPVIALHPVIPDHIFINWEPFELLREFDPSELCHIVQRMCYFLDNPPDDVDERFKL